MIEYIKKGRVLVKFKCFTFYLQRWLSSDDFIALENISTWNQNNKNCYFCWMAESLHEKLDVFGEIAETCWNALKCSEILKSKNIIWHTCLILMEIVQMLASLVKDVTIVIAVRVLCHKTNSTDPWNSSNQRFCSERSINFSKILLVLLGISLKLKGGRLLKLALGVTG